MTTTSAALARKLGPGDGSVALEAGEVRLMRALKGDVVIEVETA